MVAPRQPRGKAAAEGLVAGGRRVMLAGVHSGSQVTFGRMPMYRDDRTRCRRTTAFTLIELLVVVAILAILLAILLPALEGARAQARSVICLTHLRTQGQAVFLYAEDNDGYIGRGLMGFTMGMPVQHIYVTTILKYLGFDGDPLSLWPGHAATWLQQRYLRRVLRKVGEPLQCPDYPEEAHVPTRDEHTREPNGKAIVSLLDYVASAMPIPYTEANIRYDVAGGGDQGDRYHPEHNVPDYHGVSKLDDIAAVTNPARLIFVTEAHTGLRWDDFTYHHFFLASQLPFGAYPRIANDPRHPGGLNALFFDFHARTVGLRTLDPGWPKPLGMRLSLFTVMPDGYE